MSQSIKSQPGCNESVTAVANLFATCIANFAPEPYIDRNTDQNDGSPDNILDQLHADCLINIFEYLPLIDLCNVAAVCREFESYAQSVFRRRHSDFDLDELFDASDSEDESESEDDWIIYESDEEHERLLQMEPVKKLFRHFGAYIETIDLTDVEDDDQKHKMLELLATFCTSKDAKLNKLVLYDVTIGPRSVPGILNLSQCVRLKFLDVTGGLFPSFYIGSELTELILEDVQLDRILTVKLEKLQSLSFIDVRETLPEAFKSFLALAPHVKRLTIRGMIILRMWSENVLLSELEELELDVQEHGDLDPMDLHNFALLQHLRVFTFNCIPFPFPLTKFLKNFVKQNVSIEELYLSHFTLDYRCLTKLSNIRKLSLSFGALNKNAQLSDVIKGMPILEKLYLSGFDWIVTTNTIKATIENAPKLNELVVDFQNRHEKFIIRESDYNEICQLIAKRIDVTKLTLVLSGTEIKLGASEQIIERNRLWLDVVIVTFKDVKNVDIINYYGFGDRNDE